jgi:hypothetical protein
VSTDFPGPAILVPHPGDAVVATLYRKQPRQPLGDLVNYFADEFDALPVGTATAFGIAPTDACQLSDLRNAWAKAPRCRL